MSHFTGSGPATRKLTSVEVTHHTTSTDINALIDSGADESLMDWGLAERLGLQTELLSKPIQAHALNGDTLFTITHSEPLDLRVGAHMEHMNFYLFKSPSQALVLVVQA